MSNVEQYVDLMKAVVSNELSLEVFSKRYMSLFKKDPTNYHEEMYEVLNNVFLDSDEFEPTASSLYESLKSTAPSYVIGDKEYLERIKAALVHVTQLSERR